MAFNNNINVGAPPLLWGNVNEALRKINENFDEIIAATGLGITPVDFGTLDTNVSPTSTNTYQLGDITHQWKSVYTAEWSDTLSGSLNGLWAGSAQIKGKGLTIDLPVGSTVNGQLIIDPEKTFIKTIQVDNNKSLESSEYGFTANFTSGLGIVLDLTSASDEITFSVDPTFDLNGSILADDGVTILVDRNGYITGNVNKTSDWSVTADSKTWTFQSAGTLVFPGGATFGSVVSTGDVLASSVANDLKLTSYQNIKLVSDVNASAAEWNFSSTGEFIVPGPISLEYTGQPTISLATTTTSGRIIGEVNKTFSIILSDGAVSTPEWSFGVDGSLSFPAGQTINSTGFIGNVTGNVVGNVTGNIIGDVNGSIFSDNSTLLVDAVNNQFYGGLTGNVIGNVSGNVTGNVYNSFSSLILDTENKIVNAKVVVDEGSVFTVTTSEIGGPTHLWTFDETGNTTFPGGIRFDQESILASVNNEIALNNGGNINVRGYTGSVTIESNVDVAGKVWTFDTSGITYLPSDGVTGSVLRSPLNEGISLAAYNDSGAGTTYLLTLATTGQLNVPTSTTGKARIQNADGIELLADLKLWTFGTDGWTTFPGGGKIQTDDSSALVFESPVTFDTGITVEADIVLKDGLYAADGVTKIVDATNGTIPGYVSISTLKSVVAESIDFADFQSRIALL